MSYTQSLDQRHVADRKARQGRPLTKREQYLRRNWSSIERNHRTWVVVKGLLAAEPIDTCQYGFYFNFGRMIQAAMAPGRTDRRERIATAVQTWVKHGLSERVLHRIVNIGFSAEPPPPLPSSRQPSPSGDTA
jgi:hypothetical protein